MSPMSAGSSDAAQTSQTVSAPSKPLETVFLVMAMLNLAAGILFLLYQGAHSQPLTLLLVWGALLTSIFAWQTTLGLSIRRARDPQSNRYLHQPLRAALLASALWWGLATAWWSWTLPQDLAITSLLLACLMLATNQPLRLDYPAYRNFSLLALTPTIATGFAQLTPQSLSSGALLGLLLTLGLRIAKQSSNVSGQLGKAPQQPIGNTQHNSQNLLVGLTNSTPIGLCALDAHGQVTYLECQRLCAQTGFSTPNIGDDFRVFFANQPALIESIERALAGEALIAEMPSGEHVLQMHLNPQPEGGIIAVTLDISEHKRQELALVQHTHYDALTGLPNRSLAMEVITQAMARARRNGTVLAVYFVDLDSFKSINDTLGHQAGDELLRQAAKRFRHSLRADDFVARISGDEFLLVAEQPRNNEGAETLGHKIVANFQAPFEYQDRPLYMTCSVGIALFPRDGEQADLLLQCADSAMFAAKQNGKNNYHFFSNQMHERALRHQAVETEIRQALQKQEFELHYQPKIDVHKQTICGAEVLLRWNSRSLGPVSPNEFVPIAEMVGLMPQIGEWVLRTACREAAQWRALTLPEGQPEPRIAINVSPQQFRKTDLLANVAQALVESQLPAQTLELEITETLLVQDSPKLLNTLQAINELGVTLALDDFGTGYSSLAYLQRFPLQVLKIDKSFVQELGEDRSSESLVEAIIAMARSLHMELVAEGVETQQQLQFLIDQKVDLVQGYLYSKPLSAEEFRALLQDPATCGLKGATPQPAPEAQSKQLGSPSRRLG